MENAELYAISNKLQKRDAILCLDEYGSKIKWKPNNMIIDIGSGDGSVTTLLKKYIPFRYTILGSDISEAMVVFANKHHGNENTSFTLLDMEGPLPESMKGKFNLVFSCYAMHWAMDQERTFRNIYDLMEEDGDCLLIFLANIYVFEVYRKLALKNKWSSYLHNVERFVSPYADSEKPDMEIKALMENIGFVNIDVKCKEMHYIYDIEVMNKLEQALNPFNIPTNQLEDFTKDYYETMKDMGLLDKVGTEYKPIAPFNYRLIIVHGSKPKFGIAKP